KKKASEDEGPFVGRTGFLVAPDEGFHVFVQVSEKDHQRLFYARVSNDPSKRHQWIPIAEGNSPADSYGFPMIYRRPKDVLEIFCQVEAFRMLNESEGAIQNFRLLNGVIQNGRYRHRRSTRRPCSAAVRTSSGPG